MRLCCNWFQSPRYSPKALLWGVRSQTWSSANKPCCRNTTFLLTEFETGALLLHGIRCISRMYPSSVATWWISTGYPRWRIISGYENTNAGFSNQRGRWCRMLSRTVSYTRSHLHFKSQATLPSSCKLLGRWSSIDLVWLTGHRSSELHWPTNVAAPLELHWVCTSESTFFWSG